MSTAWLYQHPNPHAPVRANGRRFHGYPSRTSSIRAIGVHTAETAPSPASAENVARYLASTTRQASYHALVDSDSTVRLLPDEATAFGIAGYNAPALHVSFATYAARWGQHPEWDDAALARGAQVVADWCRRNTIPVRWLTRAQALAGDKGLVRHSVMDPTRRSDPGGGFPQAEFTRRVQTLLAPVPAAPELANAVRYGRTSPVDSRIARGLGAVCHWHVANTADPQTIGTVYLVGGEAVREFDRRKAQRVVEISGANRDATLDAAVNVMRGFVRGMR